MNVTKIKKDECILQIYCVHQHVSSLTRKVPHILVSLYAKLFAAGSNSA